MSYIGIEYFYQLLKFSGGSLTAINIEQMLRFVGFPFISAFEYYQLNERRALPTISIVVKILVAKVF